MRLTSAWIEIEIGLGLRLSLAVIKMCLERLFMSDINFKNEFAIWVLAVYIFFWFTGLQVYMLVIDLGTDLLKTMKFSILPKNYSFWKVYRFTGLHIYNLIWNKSINFLWLNVCSQLLSRFTGLQVYFVMIFIYHYGTPIAAQVQRTLFSKFDYYIFIGLLVYWFTCLLLLYT